MTGEGTWPRRRSSLLSGAGLPGQAGPGRMISAELPGQDGLNAIAGATGEGLSLGQAAALSGVPHGRLVVVVALADAGREPFSSWLVELCRAGAESRRQLLADLKQLGAVDARARRDWLREQGQPGPIERELSELRRLGANSEAVQLEVGAYGLRRLAVERPPMSEEMRAEMSRSFHFSETDGDGG